MLDPLREPFMQRAIAEMTLLAVAGGALGCWVVLYEYSYAAESLAHSLFPGLVLAAIAAVPLLLGATPAVVLAGIAIALVARVPGVSREVGVAVVVSAMFGLGVLLALSPASPPGIENLLFGDILGPSDADLISAALLVVVLGAALCLLHARLLAVGFDRGSAGSLGISSALAEAALLVLLAAAVVVAVQGLGNLLVVAVLVGPAAAARNLCRRIVPMIVTAVATAVLAGIGGLYLSYYAGTAGGASVALAIVAAYLVSVPAGRLGRRGDRRFPLLPPYRGVKLQSGDRERPQPRARID
jgi:ABC-type Mn2+/Zn2+ transport system permease subunit